MDKMMEQKMKEEEERKRTKEIEERMSLEETKEQVCTATISSLRQWVHYTKNINFKPFKRTSLQKH